MLEAFRGAGSWPARAPLLALASIVVASPRTQSEQPTATRVIPMQSFAADAGLDHATQNDIDFAPDGTVWLASSVGLVAFDGVEWSLYGVGGSLPGTCATAVKWSDGALWVGTDRGLGRLVDGRFVPAPAPLAAACVRRLVERVPGELWVCTATTAMRYCSGGFEPMLPDAAPIDLVPLPGGRMLVVTADRLLRFEEAGTQSLPLPPGLQLADCARAFVEDRDGRLLAATRTGILVLQGRAWQRYLADRSVSAECALLRTRDDSLILMGSADSRVFEIAFPALHPLSSHTHAPCGSVKRLIEAQDGAVWVVGDGAVLRWPRFSAGTERIDVPAPVGEDSASRLWCADAQSVVWHRNGVWHGEKDLTIPIACCKNGDVLARSRHTDAIVVLRGETRVALASPFRNEIRPRLVVDGQDTVWLTGGRDTAPRLAWLDADQHWQEVDLGAQASGVTAGIDPVPDPSGGIWLPVMGPAPRLLWVRRERVESLPLPEPLACASIGVLPDGQVWVAGRSGLWHCRPGVGWHRFGDRWTRNTHWLTTIGDRIVLGSHSSPSGPAGFAILHRDEIAMVPATSPRVVGRDARGLYVAAGASVHFISRDRPPLILPGVDATNITSVVLDTRGEVWLGGEGFAHRVSRPPEPRLVARALADYAAGHGSCLIDAQLVLPFVPRTSLLRPCATVQWRVDAGPWNDPESLLGALLITSLAPGRHRLEFAAADALARPAPIAAVLVDVAARPLEQRWWFPWSVGGLAGLILILTIQTLVAKGRLAAQAERLRDVVRRRTHKIRTELHRRSRAERRLRHQHRVLELLATGKPLPEALTALVAGLEQQLPGWRGAVSVVDGDKIVPVLPGPANTASPPPATLASPPRQRPSLPVSVEANARWQHLARLAGVEAAHAQPILATDGSPLGVLALVRPEAGDLSPEQLELVDAAAQIAAIAIDGKRGEAERQALQQQVLNAQKLRSLGLLAGGIAHDFNNLLTGILGNAGLARMLTEAGSPIDEPLVQVEFAAQRAADLCAQLLAYSGRGRFVIKPVDVSALAREMVLMLRLPISRGIELEMNLGAGLPAVEADATQLRQVLMNLITNAAEAVGDRAGCIRVVTGVAELMAARLRGVAVGHHVAPGSYVYIEVSDTGCGMNEGTRRGMFDPFFTTKPAGRGLGLAAVLGIVQGHRGAIEIESEPGRGTTMRILFPASSKAPDTAVPTLTPVRGWRGAGCVLIADDEPIVLALARTVLSGAGFDVVCATDGETAANLVLADASRFRLVLLDIVMPRLTGYEVLAKIRSVHQEIPVVLASANDMSDTRRCVRDAHAHFLQKPFGPRALLDVVGRALDASGAAGERDAANPRHDPKSELSSRP